MSAQKDRLIQAAELLGMDPDDLLSKLDSHSTMSSNRSDFLLERLRTHVGQMDDTRENFDPVTHRLIDLISELDAHLSAGGAPPEAWREGPDAPGVDSGYTYWGWDAETDLGNDDDREGVHFLTIVNPDGDECAVIVHRTCGGKYPLDGDVAQAKVRNAERIVAALNEVR